MRSKWSPIYANLSSRALCTKPFPSAPIYFWNDKHNEKYLATYFGVFPGVWVQGDNAEISSHSGIVIHGRTDSILNSAGVRIGTAEIYRQLETFNELVDYVCLRLTMQLLTLTFRSSCGAGTCSARRSSLSVLQEWIRRART